MRMKSSTIHLLEQLAPETIELGHGEKQAIL